MEITSFDREARDDEQAAIAELRLVEPGLGAEDVVIDANFLRRVYYFLLPGTVPTEHLLEANNVEVGQVLIDELFESLVLVVPASRLDSKRAQVEIQRQKAKLVRTWHHYILVLAIVRHIVIKTPRRLVYSKIERSESFLRCLFSP